jgi:hypothetical protein
MKISPAVLVLCVSLSSSAPATPVLPTLPPATAERCGGAHGYADQFEGRRTFIWRPAYLNAMKTEESAAALKAEIVARAEQALAGPAPSVVAKSEIPPSGDKHDFYSWPTYWWRVGPNEYEARDGQHNPDSLSSKFDTGSLREMQSRVANLGLGYFLTEDHRYSRKASELLTAWFVDPATAMNPNLNFGQAVPGKRPPTAIETTRFIPVIEAIGLLDPSGDLAPATQQALEAWFSRYVDWMMGPGGHDDQLAQNNHGLAYDLQLTEFALFAGRLDVAQAVLQRFPKGRMARQILSDGRLPNETRRDRGLNYSIFALGLMFQLADLGECFDADLWSYQRDGAGLHAAIDYLVPYFGHEDKWPYHESTRNEDIQHNRRLLQRLLLHAGRVYDAPKYLTLAAAYDIEDETEDDTLGWPGIMVLHGRLRLDSSGN